jgi:hypothetical protein
VFDQHAPRLARRVGQIAQRQTGRMQPLEGCERPRQGPIAGIDDTAKIEQDP